MDKFKVIIVEDVPLELKGTEGILRNEVPEADIIATADSAENFWIEFRNNKPDLVLLDLGLNGNTTAGIEICQKLKYNHPEVKVLIFTGEVLNHDIWVDAIDAKCDGIILKTGELLTRDDVYGVMHGERIVFNKPILDKIVEIFCKTVRKQMLANEAIVNYEIDEYDERLLRHLALGYTKEQISNLHGMPFGIKSLEKRQNELVQKLFPNGHDGMSINATRLVVRALELHILDVDSLHADEN